MERKKRLRRSDDIQRVRQKGKSFPHPHFVLIISDGEPDQEPRIGVISTKSVGGAVERNRSKRVLRKAAMNLFPRLRKGLELVLIARKKILDADTNEVTLELEKMCMKAGVILETSCS